MITGPPPKFHGTRDILGMGSGRTLKAEDQLCPGALAIFSSLIRLSPDRSLGVGTGSDDAG